MRKERTKICENCKKEFVFMAGSPKEYEVRRFCNAKCLGEYWKPHYKETRKADGNPMYKKKPWNYKGESWSYSGSRKRYKKIIVDGKRVWEHRYLAEKMLGRKLTENEVVHHIDHNPQNNNLNNLRVMNKTEHSSYHSKLQGNGKNNK